MNHLLNRLAIASVLSLLSTGALAQQPVYSVQHCQSVGTSPREDAADRAGHAITVGQYSCRHEGGLMNGALSTGMSITEWNGNNGEGIASNTVSRKPGAITITANHDSKYALVMTDGKVTGSAGNGRGRFAVATGSAASLLGKSYHWVTKPTGPGQFDIEITLD